MPPQTGKSKLFAHLGDKVKKSHERHRKEDTKLGVGNLPPGINGVAMLKKIETGVYKDGDNKGKPYFMATGVVVTPKEYAGAQTRWVEPLCDTPQNQWENARKTFDDHWAYIEAFLRNFGVDTDVEHDELDAATQVMVEEHPHFRFSTKQGKKTAENPNPRTYENWHEMVEAPEGSEATPEGGTEDETAAGGSDNEEPPADEAPTEENEEPPADEAPTEENDGLDELAAECEGDDKDAEKARVKMIKRGVAAGCDEGELNAAESWEIVVGMIREAETAAPADEQQEEWKPKKGDAYKYEIVNTKTKKKSKVDVEVVKVDATKSVVDLKNLDDGKTLYKGVAFDKLIRE